VYQPSVPSWSGDVPHGAEAGERGAAGEEANEAEEKRDVQEMGEEDAPEVEVRPQADDVVGEVEDQVARQVVVAAERAQQEDGGAVAGDAREVHEVVGEEVDPRDGEEDPGREREREQHEGMPAPGGGMLRHGGGGARHEARDGSCG